ncbi:hypothetical protein AZKH_4388 [Azoarcus sp. KH32C]|nr:hypothetical protein AZKH_4388 [Azoarcus sp. KH32C]
MPKLTDYVEIAAAEYIRETGRDELDSRWIAEFFQDNGVLDDYPQLDLVAFYALVQKAVAKHVDRAGKQARRHVDWMTRLERRLHKG